MDQRYIHTENRRLITLTGHQTDSQYMYMYAYQCHDFEGQSSLGSDQLRQSPIITTGWNGPPSIPDSKYDILVTELMQYMCVFQGNGVTIRLCNTFTHVHDIVHSTLR